jgi:hypothetical protein
MKRKLMCLLTITLCTLPLTACQEPQIYGSVGVSSGYGGGGWSPRVHTSISVGGRIR